MSLCSVCHRELPIVKAKKPSIFVGKNSFTLTRKSALQLSKLFLVKSVILNS